MMLLLFYKIAIEEGKRMVQLLSSGKVLPEPRKLPVKLEIEDPLEEEHGPLNKRSKVESFRQQEGITDINATPQPVQYNPLDEPSPLGLRLRKSPSLLELIQMRLSQVNGTTEATTNENLELGKKKVGGVPATAEKLKASNFPASILKIGTWECISRYEGDLVAKCYFAKHKLVWEVLEGGLKNKMEIQWSDITALKATCPENETGTLDVVLARPPLFFRETNPQPRKHTLWQATSDFTGGQASIHRRHFLQCPQGLLSKHFEKLIQCDPRLNLLSQQPEVVLDSPYFESRISVFEDQNEAKCLFNRPKTEYVSTFSSLQDPQSPHTAQSSSSVSDLRDPVSQASEAVSRGTPSPSSVMDACAVEDNGGSEMEERKETNQLEQFKIPGLHTSMSMSDLVNHIGQCISEQATSPNPLFGKERSLSKDMLNELAQHLLSDTQNVNASDEQSLMSRVNSLCCLLQKDAADQKPKVGGDLGAVGGDDCVNTRPNGFPEYTPENDSAGANAASNGCGFQQTPAISRKESVGDLLLNLPRIASLPQFLFNIAEEGDNQAR
ncbi:hypothetical protein ACLOJK_002684 [Asimina triloba]